MSNILTLCLLATFLPCQAKISPQFNHLKKYMGINLIGGYAHQTFKHESIKRFAASYNSFFASRLSTTLAIPQNFEGLVVGAEISGGIIRIGYTRRFNQPMKFEAQHTNGSTPIMEMESPKTMANSNVDYTLNGNHFEMFTRAVDQNTKNQTFYEYFFTRKH